jgi:hypothetical protein
VLRIELDDVTRPEVLALLEEHLRNMYELSPPEHVFAFDAAKLRAPDVTLWTAWSGERLVGCAALKHLSPTEGEVKSMRTPAAARRQGAGRVLLDHLLAVARQRGYESLHLETGTHPAFEPAHALYRSVGFRDCGPFADYEENSSSVFMTLRLGSPDEAGIGTKVTSVDELRRLYAEPAPRAVRKQIAALDGHCRRFIALSPFVLMATASREHHLDASPRGGEPGFVKVTDDGALLIPDAPGNNRLDSFENIVATGRIGLLFLIPGFDETLRVNGRAVLSRAEADLLACKTDKRTPKLVVRVAVEAAYLHCAKAFMRSRLWDPAAQVDRSALPTAGRMISEQTGIAVPDETREQMARRYAPDL